MRVLLVEDDEMIARAIVQALRDAAHIVDWVPDGVIAMNALRREGYGVVLLDLNLPGQDGLSILRQLRDGGNDVPVLVLTARDGIDDRVMGLDIGADDYLIKPFDLKEMMARLRAIIRRKGEATESVMAYGVLSLNPATYEARFGLTECRLSALEYTLLRALLQRPGAILSRSALERKIYGWNEQVESNAVEFLIYSVRKKLGASVIKNVRGVGWMVDKDAQPAP